MDRKLAEPKAIASVLTWFSTVSTSSLGSKVHKALAFCVGLLLSLQAYSLHPQTRLLVIAISVFAIIFAFMVLFWLVRSMKSVGHGGIQSVKRDTISDLRV
ncbi:MAG: hypothetical protein HY846_02340 [Nitrosomonadales bacterium]|nr:hypothetical protein [Nitrosomonadales bacterium]